MPSRSQWLDDLQREFHEKDRLRIIDRYIANIPGIRVVNSICRSRNQNRHTNFFL